MKYCEHCKANINTTNNYCPICFNEIEEIEDNTTVNTPLFSDRKIDEKITKRSVFLYKLFFLLSLTVVIVSAFINYLVLSTKLWWIMVLVAVIYVWVLVGHTIISKRNAFEKVFFQVVSLLILLYTTDYFSGGGDWFVQFVMPGISIVTFLVLSMISLANKKRYAYLLSFFIIYMLLIIMSIVILCVGLDTFKLLNQFNIILGVLITFATILFGHKTLKNTFLKNFHV